MSTPVRRIGPDEYGRLVSPPAGLAPTRSRASGARRLWCLARLCWAIWPEWVTAGGLVALVTLALTVIGGIGGAY